MKASNPDAFGARLRALRKAAKLTQQQVADTLRIHRTSYTKYETDGVTPDQQGLIALAELFGVTVDYLVGREERSDRPDPHVANDDLALSDPEALLLQMFRQLDYEEQLRLTEQIQQAFRQQKKLP